MSIQHGKAGRSTRQMEARRGFRREIIILVILVLGFLFLLALPHLGKIGGITGAVVILAFLWIFRVVMEELGKKGKKVKREERRAGRGAQAEEDMGNLFDSLPDDYFVLNDINSAHGNIDHLVISKTKGLFLIETKSHHGRITAEGNRLLLNGHPPEKDFISQTVGNCMWLKDWVKVNLQINAWVTGMIVFTNAFVEVRRPVHGIHVVNKGYFQRFLERQPDTPRVSELWEHRDRMESLIQSEASIR